MALDLRGIGLGDSEVGVEDIPSVVGGLGGDGVLFAFPLEDAGVVDAVGEIFVGFELLEGASGLAGDFLLAMSLSAMAVYFFYLCFGRPLNRKRPLVILSPRAIDRFGLLWRLFCSGGDY